MRKRDWLVTLALALCVVGLVSCGGGSSSGSGAESASREEAGLEFTECMRDHGVEMPDPRGDDESIQVDPSDPAARQALALCDEKLDRVAQEITPEQDEEFREGWLAFAQCMREEGIEMGDPRFLGPEKMLLDIDGIDTESPAFEVATEACEDEAPASPDGPTIGG